MPEPFTTLERLFGTLPGITAPSREGGLLFTALVISWALLELLVGNHGLHMRSVDSDRGSALAVLASAGAAIWLAAFVAGLKLLPIGAVLVQWLGLAAMACGLALRLFAILWLGPMFTRMVQIVPGHRLVTSGPYRMVRHPSYSGLLLFFAGMGLALGSWAALLVMLTVPLLGILYRIKVEEEQLIEAFGQEYGAYRQKVKALVPYVV